MTKIPPDGVLESRIKSDQPKIVLELYDMETHQKKPMAADQEMETMVMRSVD